MRITERRLRSNIRSVIKENIEESEEILGMWTEAGWVEEKAEVAELLQCEEDYLYYLDFDENFEALKRFCEKEKIDINKTCSEDNMIEDNVQVGKDGRRYVILEPYMSPVPFLFSCGKELANAPYPIPTNQMH